MVGQEPERHFFCVEGCESTPIFLSASTLTFVGPWRKMLVVVIVCRSTQMADFASEYWYALSAVPNDG